MPLYLNGPIIMWPTQPKARNTAPSRKRNREAESECGRGMKTAEFPLLASCWAIEKAPAPLPLIPWKSSDIIFFVSLLKLPLFSFPEPLFLPPPIQSRECFLLRCCSKWCERLFILMFCSFLRDQKNSPARHVTVLILAPPRLLVTLMALWITCSAVTVNGSFALLVHFYTIIAWR